MFIKWDGYPWNKKRSDNLPKNIVCLFFFNVLKNDIYFNRMYWLIEVKRSEFGSF